MSYEIKTKAGAELKLAFISKSILNTAWYQWGRRRKLYKEAKAIAEKWHIQF